MSLHYVSLSPQTSDIWQCHTHTHTHTQQRSSKHSLQRSILKWEQTLNTLTNQYGRHSLSLSLEKNKSCPHRCHQSGRTNGALTCQRRWGVCRRKEKRGEMKGGKAWGRWEKRVWRAGAVSIFMRTDFLFDFNLSVSGGLCLKRHPTPTRTLTFEAHLLTFYMLNK